MIYEENKGGRKDHSLAGKMIGNKKQLISNKE